METSIEMMQKVAQSLGPLLKDVVFVGGTIPSLLITDSASPSVRVTKDVDLIVNSSSYYQHAMFEKKLRARGFQIQAPPACRYGIGDVLVDVMTTTSKAAGFSDPWYAEAFATAETITLPDGTFIRIVRAPIFIATKLSAWHDRGKGDYYAEDIEDILAVIDGRSALLDEIRESSSEIQCFFAEEFRRLLADDEFLDCVPGHLGGDTVAYQRADKVMNVMREIVTLE